MNATQYNQALKISTMAAVKGGVALHEIVGMLELAKANVVQLAISGRPSPNIVHVSPQPPPGDPG